MMIKTAMIVDGSFFLKRFFYFHDKKTSPEDVVDFLYKICEKHLHRDYTRDNKPDYLLRIFYYDCAPLNINVQHPLTKEIIHFNKHPEAIFRHKFFNELKKRRKVALRIGYLQDRKRWKISRKKKQALLAQEITVSDLKPYDLSYDVIQKGADIKIGVDITTLSLKKQVDRIILLSGDADFISAAKLARKEGVEFTLDSLGNHVNPELYEHIDELVCSEEFKKPTSKPLLKSSLEVKS